MDIAVIFGGRSDEHEVSRNSAVNVLKSLEGGRYEVSVIGITKEGRWYLTEADYDEIASGDWEKRPDNRQVCIPSDPVVHGLLVFDENDHAEAKHIDCIVPVLHGDYGEDGTIQGVFEMADIPYVGPGVKASANCMDKTAAKVLAAPTGVTMAKCTIIEKKDFEEDRETEVLRAVSTDGGKFPLFVKPSSAGSSVGTRRVDKREELEPAIENAFKYDNKVLVEEMIVGREIEVAVLGNHDPKATEVGEILSAGEFYDYDSKYNNPDSKTRVVDDLPRSVIDEIRRYAVEIYKALDCRGLSRVDFFYDNSGRIVFNEINTLPGFTNISMYPKLWEAMGIEQPVLTDTLIKLALEEHGEQA
jgi:D-alanine-D-alanine ligase